MLVVVFLPNCNDWLSCNTSVGRFCCCCCCRELLLLLLLLLLLFSEPDNSLLDIKGINRAMGPDIGNQLKQKKREQQQEGEKNKHTTTMAARESDKECARKTQSTHVYATQTMRHFLCSGYRTDRAFHESNHGLNCCGHQDSEQPTKQKRWIPLTGFPPPNRTMVLLLHSIICGIQTTTSCRCRLI